MIVPILIFGVEYVIKNWIEKNKTEGCREEIMGGRILLRKYHNKGACLNLGEKKRQLVLFASVGLTVLATVIFLFTLTKKGNGMLKAGLALLLGGAYSNTYDRLRRKYVVDYFSFPVKGRLGNIIFNLSDFAILIGALITGWKLY